MTKRKRVRRNPLEEAKSMESHELETGAVEEVGRAVTGIEEPIERIERLLPSQIVPDRFQPRRLLPAGIRNRFFRGEIDCYKAAREWLKLAEKDTGWERQIHDLLSMGDSFQEHGQIKPLTGTWVPAPDGGYRFQIETGERRFWAACLQRVKEGIKAEPALRVEIVAQHTRHRQVIENRHAQSPSAIGQACEVAALLLERVGIKPDPRTAEEYDYFKKAVEIRAPRGFWAGTEPIMRLSTRRMQQLLKLLQFPSELLEYADRHRIPERVLREVVQLQPKIWAETLKLIIERGLTSDEVIEIQVPGKETKKRPKRGDGRRTPSQIAMSGIRRFTRAAFNVDGESDLDIMLDDVADEVVVGGIAEELTPLLQQLLKRIEARLSRK